VTKILLIYKKKRTAMYEGSDGFVVNQDEVRRFVGFLFSFD